jgi:hypothetical protein
MNTNIIKKTIEKQEQLLERQGTLLKRQKNLLAQMQSTPPTQTPHRQPTPIQNSGITKKFPDGHYYSVIPSAEDLTNTDLDKEILGGVNLNEQGQIALFQQIKTNYNALPKYSDQKTPGLRYHYNNQSYDYGDSTFLHLMLRHINPNKIIEIGSGFSSSVMLDTNELFWNNSKNITFIEPYPELLFSLLNEQDKKNHTFVIEKLQNVNLNVFDELQPGDVLFIDSTHVSKLGSDVNFYLFEVLPRLKSGVYIHIHDIFYPFEYPKIWLDSGVYWNELYMLKAFLQYNENFKIKLFPDFLFKKHPDLFDDTPVIKKNPGAQIWLQKQ